MQKLLLVSIILGCTLVAQAQRVTAYQLLPANATANDTLRLVVTVAYGGCGTAFGYSVSRVGTALNVRGCYPAVTVAMPCTKRDTIRLGRLPTGSYTVSASSFVVMQPANCPGTILAAGQPSAIGSFTVGSTALAVRRPISGWQFWPTLLPATSSVLHLSPASALRQISIHELTGRLRANYGNTDWVENSGDVQLTLPDLAPGLFLLRVVDGDGHTSTQRFVRQ